MARNKVGLDYFALDCHMDEKVRLIQAEFGLKGFAIVVKLYQKIYGEFGYYCEWSEDSLLLFMSENGVSSDSKNLIQGIVAACIRRGIFSEKMYKKYGVLTSVEVQETYLGAVSRRTSAEMKKEYLLISVDKINDNVVIIEDNVDINEKNVDINAQSREEKSIVDFKNILHKDAVHAQHTDETSELFEELWQLYPNKKGKSHVTKAAKKRLLDVGRDEMIRAIERYKTELEKDSDWRQPQYGSTFFNSGYVDYLDTNYVPSQPKKPKKNSFNDFSQRDCDCDELEAQLLKKRC